MYMYIKHNLCLSLGSRRHYHVSNSGSQWHSCIPEHDKDQSVFMGENPQNLFQTKEIYNQASSGHMCMD